MNGSGEPARGARRTGRSAEISELCRSKRINPTHDFGWKKQRLPSAIKVFESGWALQPSAKEQRLESEPQRAKDVVVDTTAEFLDRR